MEQKWHRQATNTHLYATNSGISSKKTKTGLYAKLLIINQDSS
jgi:hypothetical protein